MTIKEFLLSQNDNSLKGIKNIRKYSYLLDKEIATDESINTFNENVFHFITATDGTKCVYYTVECEGLHKFLDDKDPIDRTPLN